MPNLELKDYLLKKGYKIDFEDEYAYQLENKFITVFVTDKECELYYNDFHIIFPIKNFKVMELLIKKYIALEREINENLV